ncbi:MAG: toxic anion resistance protein [Bifidobacteriaceae bacterium]|jgi:uncharacterized protein YaaN involved in tellurite resistance|nr:toxic anion resistance protein [Bifidobacteriaceae bacterium]
MAVKFDPATLVKDTETAEVLKENNIDLTTATEEDSAVAAATQAAVEIAPEENLSDVKAARTHTEAVETFVSPMLPKLTADQQAEIRKQAPALLKKFLDDENQLIEFGSSATADIDAVVNKLLVEQAKMDIPEVNDLLKNVNKDIEGFTAKYSEDEASLEKKVSKLGQFFKDRKRDVKDWQFDSKNLMGKFDEITQQIVEREEILKRNVITANILIEKNKESTDALLGVIAFLEAVHECAFKDLETLKSELDTLTSGTPEYLEKADQVDVMGKTVIALENQRADYLNRYFIAVSSNTGMRNIARISADTRVRLKQLKTTTLSTMKLVVSQLGMLQQAKKGEETAKAIIDANDAATKMYAKTLGTALPSMAKSSQASTLTVEAVQALTDGVIASNNGLIEAIAYGREQKKQVAEAISQSVSAINDSTKVRDEAIINEILNTAKKNEEEIKSNAPESA